MRSFEIVSVLVLACAFFPAGAPVEADIVHFDSDPPGPKPNGWMSVDSGLISFTDSVGADLIVNAFAESNFSDALAVRDDSDDSHLIMNFSFPMTALSMDFGNDDPGFSNPGDLAVLTLFLTGFGQVGQVTVIMNRDDMMNQSISYVGVPFDSATFKYDVPPSLGLTEVVDNVQFLPEPAVLTLLAFGCLVACRRRR